MVLQSFLKKFCKFLKNFGWKVKKTYDFAEGYCTVCDTISHKCSSFQDSTIFQQIAWMNIKSASNVIFR